jgi:hypothetical protein
MILIIALNILVTMVGILTYTTINLLKKNEKLEDIAFKQNNYVVAINDEINQINKKLKELDDRGTFKSDDEIGWFFNRFKNILNILEKYEIK